MKTLFILFLSLQTLAQTTVLELGQSKNYPASSERIWIEKSAILKAEPFGSGVRLTAKKVGSSMVRINSKNETIEVLHPDQMALYQRTEKLVSTKPGLQVDIEEGAVVLKGYLHDWKTWKEIAKDLSFSSYKMYAKPSDELKQTMQKHFDEDLQAQGLLSVNVIQEPHLEVRLNPQQAGLDRYRDYFERLGISLVVAAESLEMLPVVRVDITVVEIDKDFMRQVGLQFPESTTFNVVSDKMMTYSGLEVTLNTLEKNGHAKTLASPNIICRSGKEAEFLAGGEIPIKIANYEVHDVIWKKYGVLLKIKPLADSTGRMSLSIETEVSTPGPKTDGVPEFLTNRVSSQFDLSHSQVVALSGLLKEVESKDISGLPFLTSLPVLGPLFSSNNYQNHKTELVIFVHPQLMDQKSNEEWTKGPAHVSTSL
jgi:pilus assembly protein CpaC